MMCIFSIPFPDQTKLLDKDLIMWGFLYAVASYLNNKNEFKG